MCCTTRPTASALPASVSATMNSSPLVITSYSIHYTKLYEIDPILIQQCAGTFGEQRHVGDDGGELLEPVMGLLAVVLDLLAQLDVLDAVIVGGSYNFV